MKVRQSKVVALTLTSALVGFFAWGEPRLGLAQSNAVAKTAMPSELVARRTALLASRRHANSGSLAYVIINSNVEVYSVDELIANANPAPLKTITGFISPTAITTDAQGDFFVADTLANTVYGFKPGQIQPYVRYNRGLSNPFDVVVGTDGTVYVINDGYHKGAQVVEFAPGKQRITRTLSVLPNGPSRLALDGQNNLYVAFFSSEGGGGVEVFAPGATTGTNLNLEAMPQAEGLVVDSSGDIVVSGFLNIPVGQSQGRAIGAIAFYIAGLQQPTFQGSAPLYPGQLALTSDESAIFVADSQDSLLTFQYGPSADFVPLGLLPFSNTDVRGVAVSPRDPA